MQIQIITDDDNSRGFIFASTKNAFAICFNIGGGGIYAKAESTINKDCKNDFA